MNTPELTFFDFRSACQMEERSFAGTWIFRRGVDGCACREVIDPLTAEGLYVNNYKHLVKSRFWQHLKVQSLMRYRTSCNEVI